MLDRLIPACVLAMAMSPASADGLLVAAASSLTDAFKELATQFESAHPGTTVSTSFGASDVVLRQIMHGAPVDVFASADQAAMDKALQAGVVDPATRANFVSNELVLIVPRDNPADIRSLEDLRGGGVRRIAFGSPASVPSGRYTRDALQASGIWEAVLRRAVPAQNVRQVLSYVERGEVDAGFVFATDAAIMRDRVAVVRTIPTPTPVLYPIALVRREGRGAAARAFLDYVLSGEGRAVFVKYGFSLP
jgi:molybdate transport system substrate-binding protein